jgi:ABC-2 type transport system ATP-binding protein
MICNDNKQAEVVECKGLTKVYRKLLAGRSRDVRALQSITLSVAEGQIVGLIGPNGAGKSTLLNLMAGLIFPTEGHVSICGHPARSIEARSGLGYMPEHPTFLGRYSAWATLKYHGALLGLSRQDVSAQIDKLTEQLEMDEYIDRPCADFSQGMKQRLALAIALMNDPRFLLLDEPSNGLDPIGIIQLRDLLKKLRDAGTAIVISSHRLGELEKLTNDYIFLYRGEVVSFGDKIEASGAGRVHVGLVANGNQIAKKLLPQSKLISSTETELVITVGDENEVSDIIDNLVENGARITSVLLQKEDIEDVFLRLYNERN